MMNENFVKFFRVQIGDTSLQNWLQNMLDVVFGVNFDFCGALIRGTTPLPVGLLLMHQTND